MVRLHKEDRRTGRPHGVRHPALPQQRVPQSREASCLLGAGQDEDQRNLRHQHSLLDRLARNMYK